MTDRKPPLAHRRARLVLSILGLIADADEPILWRDLVETIGDAANYRTVENVLYELDAFGAIHRVGKPGTARRPDTRALKMTPLGEAWLAQEPPPALPGQPDPIDQADAIAETHDHDIDLPAVTLQEDETP